MGKVNFAKMAKGFKKTMDNHSPEILTAIGITGMVSTVVAAVSKTPKALDRIEQKKEELEKDKLTVKEVVSATWDCYLSAAITGGVSIACLIGAAKVNRKRNAVLATAYTISEAALRDYREKVIETVGEEKEQTIQDSVAKAKIEQKPVAKIEYPVSKSEVIITDNGNTFCCDGVFGRYFYSDINKIKSAVNEINRRMINEMYVSLNDFYYELDIKGIPMGDDLGWNIDNGTIEINFSSQIAEDGRPCLVIMYSLAPRYDYSKLM